jgi:hypothetical protein
MPWIMVPYYALMTAVGAAILGVPLEGDVTGQIGLIFERPVYRAAFWHGAVDVLWPFLWSFVLGSFAGAAVIALAGYVTARRLVEQMKRTGIKPTPPAGD